MSDSQNIDFGLSLDVSENRDTDPVVQGPWGKADKPETEVAAESRDKALEARKAKPPEKRLEEAGERMKARVLASMADAMGSDDLSLDERLAKMALLAKRYIDRPAFKPGDLVTASRKVQGYRGYGEPHIVLEFVSDEAMERGWGSRPLRSAASASTTPASSPSAAASTCGSWPAGPRASRWRTGSRAGPSRPGTRRSRPTPSKRAADGFTRS